MVAALCGYALVLVLTRRVILSGVEPEDKGAKRICPRASEQRERGIYKRFYVTFENKVTFIPNDQPQHKPHSRSRINALFSATPPKKVRLRVALLQLLLYPQQYLDTPLRMTG